MYRTIQYRLFLASFLFMLCAIPSFTAHGETISKITIENAWIRATVPQQKVIGAFMKITASGDTWLVGLKSPIAGH